MSILSIRHLTLYRYRKPVGFGEHRMMFRPLESYDQRLISAELVIGPEPSQIRNVHDVFGNWGSPQGLCAKRRLEVRTKNIGAEVGVRACRRVAGRLRAR